MATPTSRSDAADPLGIAPAATFAGPGRSLLMVMSELGPSPATGRLLRGLTPWLDAQGTTEIYLLAERKRREPWRNEDRVVSYQELVYWHRAEKGGYFRGAVWKGEILPAEEIIEVFQREPTSAVDYAARRMQAAVVSSRDPLWLSVHHEPKPWGREGWYTGFEERGVSRVRSASGESELPYALGMFPVPILGEGDRPPILLKTLEPFPDPVLGDLYLEVHEEKWETYVVLEVDEDAWPTGEGELLAGLDPGAIERYRAEHGENGMAALRGDLRERIGAYEAVRREIDNRIDEIRVGAGEGTDRPLAPERYGELTAGLPAKLRADEKRLREEVESLFGKTPLRVGDVVALPPGVIHSLRHGVKVVEFQTPTYERLIAMFAQKVLTQSHWDTEAALNRMNTAPFSLAVPEVVEREPGYVVERVVSYPEFEVHRLRANPGARRPEVLGEGCHLLFVVQGSGRLIRPDGSGEPLVKQDALIIPRQMGRYEIEAPEGAPLTWLKAIAREPEAGAEGD